MKNILPILLSIFTVIACHKNNDQTLPPDAPSGLTATAISFSQISLSWTDNSTNETGFRINRKSGTDSFALIATVAANITTFKDTGLTAHTAYTYNVLSFNSAGNSATASNNASATTAGIMDTTIRYLPALTTLAIDSIGQIFAGSGGLISSDSGSAITARGAVWDTASNPTISLSTKTNNGTGIGSYISDLTGLIPNKTYFVRAYATNSAGTGYGNQLSFSTLPLTIPFVSTTNIIYIDSTSLTCYASVNGSGGAPVTAAGIVWSTSPNPTISLFTKTSSSILSGAFNSIISGLSPDSTYYFQAYAINSVGAGYGNQLVLATWMKQNLDVATYSNGDTIPEVTDSIQWASLTTGAWCYYNNDPANEASYGKLYNWYAINDSRGLAPMGWHIPSSAEWDNLINVLGGSTKAGGNLKSISLWASPNDGATNLIGFSANPGGYRDLNGSFNSLGTYGSWISTYTSGGYVYSRSMASISYGVTTNFGSPLIGYSVRCVKN
jgi:uncharacterized protein (TIGR02145 family)